MSKYDTIEKMIENKIQQEIEMEYNKQFNLTTFNRVQEIIHEQTGVNYEEIKPGNYLMSFDGKLVKVRIMEDIEEEFNIKITMIEFAQISTVQDIVNLLESKG